MKHLTFNEFKELMKSKGETTITTNDGTYLFTGKDNHKVEVKFYLKMKKNYQMKDGGFSIVFEKTISLAESQCMYESLK